MLLAAKSWRLRESARQALKAGDYALALDAATRAEALQHTRSGAALRALGCWGLTERKTGLRT